MVAQNVSVSSEEAKEVGFMEGEEQTYQQMVEIFQANLLGWEDTGKRVGTYAPGEQCDLTTCDSTSVTLLYKELMFCKCLWCLSLLVSWWILFYHIMGYFPSALLLRRLQVLFLPSVLATIVESSLLCPEIQLWALFSFFILLFLQHLSLIVKHSNSFCESGSK